MSKILIIGNVLKDVYLKLDERQNDFETDEAGISWLELGFNGAAHTFYRRTSVFGGAAVSLAVLNELGIEAGILNAKTEMKAGEISWSDDPADYRYIFSHKGGITYFVPSERKATEWIMPAGKNGTPEWILVDRSTVISNKLVDELNNFLKFSHGTKLAVHAEKKNTPAGKRLAEMADILFVEEEPPVHVEEKIVDVIEVDKPNTQLVCHITPRKLSLGDAEESWTLDRADMMTHLTVYSTIVATVLGIIIAGGTPTEALLSAKLNAENATLEGGLKADALRDLVKKELEKRANLKLITRSLMTSGKGILAIDESERSFAKRLAKFKIPDSRKKREEFYRMMLTTPELKGSISGVILSEENSKLRVTANKHVLEYLTERGVIPGIKADQGLTEMKVGGEMHTLGLYGLAEKLRKWYDHGFRFAKWRAAFEIAENKPGYFAVEENAKELASFAKECQLVGLVPVVEVDILADGDYPVEKNAEVLDRVLVNVFEKLEQRHVNLAGCLLKCNMVRNGKDAEVQAEAEQVGMATVAILKHAVPRYMAGVLLLSGGQAPKEATKNLTEVMHNSPFPWPVTFAFSRAFEEPVLATWKGNADNVKAGQAAFVRHLAANCDALHYSKVEPRGGAMNVNQISVLDLG